MKLEDYKGLWMPEDMSRTLVENPEAVEQVVNGIGPAGWAWLFFDTIWLLNVKLSANIHDWMWTYPDFFDTEEDALKWEAYSNRKFLDNIIVQIEKDYHKSKWKWMARKLRYLRISRARKYYFGVKYIGTYFFLKNKIINNNKK